jgi:hypothetical protein
MLQALTTPGAPPRADAAPQPAAGATKRVARHHHGRRTGLEDRVALLTGALDLDAKQQASLRKVLMDQRDQAQRIWSDASLPSAQRIGMTKALSRHTGDRIRAFLTPEQRKKYEPPSQADQESAITNAHVEDWMQGAKQR